MNIDEVKSLCAENRLRWTNHAMVRLAQRRISITEVMEALQNGEIIEQYADDHPYPSCLILGICTAGKTLHVVCSINTDDTELWIITAYIPETAKWSDDFKLRKETT